MADDKEKRGFCGFDDLISDISQDIEDTHKTSKQGPGLVNRSESENPELRSTASHPKSHPESNKGRERESIGKHAPSLSQYSGISDGAKWFFGLVVVMGGLILLGYIDDNRNESSYSSESKHATGTERVPIVPFNVPKETSTTDSDDWKDDKYFVQKSNEDKPPVGANLILKRSQIRYCLAEEIRLSTIDGGLNRYSENEVELYNARVNDYNSRCGSYRYRAGYLQSVRREVEAKHNDYRSEGVARLQHWRGRSVPSRKHSSQVSTPKHPDPDPLVLSIQKRLNELGYNSGKPDGLIGRNTRSAIMAFQSDKEYKIDGKPSNRLLQQLTAKRKSSGYSSLAKPSIKNSQTAKPKLGRTYDKNREENLQTCLSGDYPSLCKKQLLTQEVRRRVEGAERRENLKTCLSGNYTSLCKKQLLTQEERRRVEVAERRENLKTCLSGNYTSLCKKQLLTQEERRRVEVAERRENLKTCLSGNYTSLCKKQLLTQDERRRVEAAERRENLKTCLSGYYSSICNKVLLTDKELARVNEAERRSR